MTFRLIAVMGIRRDELSPPQWARLGATGKQLLALGDSPAAFRKLPPEVDCLLVNLGERVGLAEMARAPRLRYIGVFGTGFEGVDLQAASDRGIIVTNVPGYSTEAVAEFVISTALTHLRDLPAPLSPSRSEPIAWAPRELAGRSFGVVGLGRIGRRVAQIASAGFGARVTYWSRRRKADAEAAGIAYADLDAVLRRSEVLSVNLALNPETRGLLDARRVRMVSKGAVVVCLAPLELFDTQALVRQLQGGVFRFATDHGEELTGPARRTLTLLPNVSLLPSVANTTEEATQARREAFLSNVEHFLAGDPVNVVCTRPAAARIRRTGA